MPADPELMRFFERHRKDADPVSPAGVFWSWWSRSGAAAVAAAVDGQDGTGQGLDDLLTARVQAMSPGLVWECGPAGTAGPGQRVLTVTSAGNPQARAAARRWLLAAPRTEGWTFTDSRPGATDPRSVQIQLGGWNVDVASAVAGAHVRGGAVDVAVHHPVFMDVDEDTAKHLAFLLLDTVLGEQDVELWVGEVEVAEEAPLDAVPLTGLRPVVDELRSRAVGVDGSPTWVLLSGQTPEGARVVASARQPLRSASAPQLDTYVGVFLAFADATEEGLPGPAALVELRALEDDLAGLGARGEVVAHQTSGGIRVLHVYVDSTTDGERFVRAASDRWRAGKTQVQSQLDPGWSAVGHLRG